MQSYFCFYTIVTVTTLAVSLIINWRQLFDWRDLKSRLGALDFRFFIISLFLFFLSDVLWGIFAGLEYPKLLYYDTLYYFLAMALSLHMWARYVVAYLEMHGWQRSCLLWVGRAMLAYFITASIVNFFNDAFFTIDEHAVFTPGPLRRLAFWLMIAYNTFGSALTFARLLRTRGVRLRRHIMVFTFGVTMAVAVLMQISNPLLPYYALGCLLGCCLLHVFVFEDERDEMHHREMMTEAQLEAEREANRAKSLFFSTVSHDIRTPLNAIIGFSELLEQGTGDAGERERFLSSIRSSGKLLARLVDDVLDLSKLESGKLEIVNEPTDVPAVAHEVISACEVVRARKSLALKYDIGHMPCLSVDPQRIRQILFNLLSNAYKYTERGSVTVHVSFVPSNYDPSQGTLTLSIADTGKGISKEDISRILQPFVQVADNNHRDGTGLGLSICNKLATLMGGELTIKSEVGVGSTFTVTLYDVNTAETLNKHSEEGEVHLGHSPSRVLVVDDSPVNRAVLKAMLAKSGVTDIATAGNGREAMKILNDDPNFDLVLSDLWMPEMDGCELVRAIRADEKLSHLPVYLVTADVEARKQAGSDGFTGIFLKPITLDRLLTLFS